MSDLTKSLSKRGEAIRDYKLRANDDGAEAWWSLVTCAPDVTMHIPKRGVVAVGADEINTKVFGNMSSTRLQQELIEIHEFGLFVTCYLRASDDEEQSERQVVEVFLFDDQDQVVEIWALA